MAAPMLLASRMPISTTWPTVAEEMRAIALPSLASRHAPAPVTVHWAAGVRWLPYSSGNLNWRSDEQKCEEATEVVAEEAPAEEAPAEEVVEAPAEVAE